MKEQMLRAIPKVDELLRHQALQAVCREYGLQVVTGAVREELDQLRGEILRGKRTEMISEMVLFPRGHQTKGKMKRMMKNASSL